jgi:hypothetical protein
LDRGANIENIDLVSLKSTVIFIRNASVLNTCVPTLEYTVAVDKFNHYRSNYYPVVVKTRLISIVNNISFQYFGSPLMVAAFHGYYEIVVLLCDRGADIEARGVVSTVNGETYYWLYPTTLHH